MSGELRQVKPLDYEATASLTLWIEAKTYPFGDARTSYGSLLINVSKLKTIFTFFGLLKMILFR